MRPYEVMVILDAGLEEDAIRATIDRATGLLASRGGNPGRVERWGKRRFAYELGHRWEGYYVLVEAAAEPAAMAELDRMLSLADEVIRHKVIRVPDAVAGRAPPGPARGRHRRGGGRHRRVERERELSAMSNGNNVTLVGNITRDPELRFTPSGQATASFGLAVNRRWQDRQSGEWQEATSFFDVVCWREMAENVSESLTRGARVVVTGRLEQRSWENQEGEKRSKVEVVADEIGPSLRWATAAVTKNERRSPGEGGSPGGREALRQPAPAAAPAAGYDEEPF